MKMNEDNFILEDVDRELSTEEKIQKIIDEFEPKAIEFGTETDYSWSVKIQDQKSGMEFWVDVWVDKNYKDVETEWNQYIFDIQDEDDQIRSAVQDNDYVWDLASSEAVHYLEESNIIEQLDNGNWEVVYHTPESEHFEIYEEKYNDETGDIEGVGRIWDTETGKEKEFVFTFDIMSGFIYYNELETGDELDIRNQDLKDKISSLIDEYKSEIEANKDLYESKNLNESKYAVEYRVTETGEVVRSEPFDNFIDAMRYQGDILKKMQDKLDYCKYVELEESKKVENVNNSLENKIKSAITSQYEIADVKVDEDKKEITFTTKAGSEDDTYVCATIDFLENVENAADNKIETSGEGESACCGKSFKITYKDKDKDKDKDIKKEAKEDATYKYQGYTFIPVGNIKSNLDAYDFISKNDKLNTEFDKEKGTYNYDEFYKVVPPIDIFEIKELDNIKVMPGGNFMFEYTGDDDTITPIAEIPSDEELKTADADGYIGMQEDKEIIDDILNNEKDYSDIASKYGYSFNDYQLYNMATLYAKSGKDIKTKIEDILTDINYHSECAEIMEDADKFKTSLFESKVLKIENINYKEAAKKIYDISTEVIVNDLIKEPDCDERLKEIAEKYKALHKLDTELDDDKFIDLDNEAEEIIAELAGIDYSDLGENKKIKTESMEEPEEDKNLDFEERVKLAYEKCDYSVRPDMPTLTDILDYLDMLNTQENRDKIEDIIYNLGYDWQLESKQIKGNKIIEDVAINNGFNVTRYPEVQSLADDIANSIKDKEKVTIIDVIMAIENWDNGDTSVFDIIARVDKDLANKIETDEDNRYEAENQFLGLVEDTLNDMGITVYDEDNYDEYYGSKKIEAKENNIITDEEIETAIRKYLDKTGGIFTDDSVYNVAEIITGIADIYKLPKGLTNRIWNVLETRVYNKLKTEDATQCGAVDGGKVDLFGSKEKKTENKELSRVEKLKLMDIAARSINDEDIFELWLMCGVPDGATEIDFEEIADDEQMYKDIENEFIKVMKLAVEDGLYKCPEEALEFAKQYVPDIENYVQ